MKRCNMDETADQAKRLNPASRSYRDPVQVTKHGGGTPEEKVKSEQLSAEQVELSKLAGEKIQSVLTRGLGNVAGDQLKAVSDLGVPVVGVGLLYQQGYFRQVIDRHGAQQALYVTNGVHVPTWDSAAADDLWTEACGKDRLLGTAENMEQDIRRVSDLRLWQFRNAASTSFVEYARERLSRQLSASGASSEDVDRAKHLWDPNALNIHVRGYKEEGTITTPFDMTVLNDLDRFHLVMDTIDRVPKIGKKGHALKQRLQAKLVEHKQYIEKHGQDLPEIRNWKWGATHE